jgi:predicted ABC-type ATPase
VNPNVYIIAGPNGVGKTTFAREFLPNYANCKIFINADLIAAGMSPFDPGRAAFRAGRLMLEEIEIRANLGVDFGFETTLSGKDHLQLVRGLKRRGYEVPIFYLRKQSRESSRSTFARGFRCTSGATEKSLRLHLKSCEPYRGSNPATD